MNSSEDRFGTIVRALSIASVYAASWIVAHTFIPMWLFEVVAFLLVVVPIGVGIAVAWAIGLELSPGQCRAETNSEDRCSRRRPPNRDLCWQHRRLNDVTIHPEGIAGKQAESERTTLTFE